jgi:hypothetical protein
MLKDHASYGAFLTPFLELNYVWQGTVILVPACLPCSVQSIPSRHSSAAMAGPQTIEHSRTQITPDASAHPHAYLYVPRPSLIVLGVDGFSATAQLREDSGTQRQQ